MALSAVPDTFPNPGVTSVALTMADVPGRCLLVDDVCTFDVLAWYGPRQECVTMETFARIVNDLTASPITAEGLAVAIRVALRHLLGDAWIRVKVRHHPKDGVELTAEV
jgi:NADPH-dependent 7-cyano-7-deazaguanine reductase QueF